MQISLLLLGLAPLIVFAILDSFFSLKVGLIGAIVAVLFEAGLSLYFIGEIDNLTLFNVVLILLFVGISWKFNKPEYFKMQPSIMSAVFGAILWGSYLLDKPILKEFFIKYRPQILEMLQDSPIQMAMIQSELFLNLLAETCMTFGVLLFGHAALTAYTAFKKGNGAWIAARVSWYLFMFIAMIWARARVFS